MRQHHAGKLALLTRLVEGCRCRVEHVDHIADILLLLALLVVVRDVEGSRSARGPAQIKDFGMLHLTDKSTPVVHRRLVLLPPARHADDDVARLDMWWANPHQLNSVGLLQRIPQLHRLQLIILKQELLQR